MAAQVKVDTRAFRQMCRELAAKAKVPDETVLVAEVGKVLEGAARNTKAGSKAKIASRFKNATFSMQPSDMYSPKSGRTGVNVSANGFIPYYLRNRYPDNLWALMSARRNASFAAAIAAIGLSKRSWFEIAKRLGLTISVPAYAKKAVASTGKDYPENISIKIERGNGKLQISFFNSQPTVNKIGGARALQVAIDGRVKGFLVSLSKGTFTSAAKIAAKYPGIRITQ